MEDYKDSKSWEGTKLCIPGPGPLTARADSSDLYAMASDPPPPPQQQQQQQQQQQTQQTQTQR
jgi:hypothetical protein